MSLLDMESVGASVDLSTFSISNRTDGSAVFYKNDVADIVLSTQECANGNKYAGLVALTESGLFRMKCTTSSLGSPTFMLNSW